MSKYIIDTDQFEKLFETKAVAVLGIGDNLAVPEEGEKTVWTRMLNVADLEELNSDYINEHYGSLQDDAYQRGFEDGKAINGKVCEGCKYAGKVVTGPPCISCRNSYKNQWTAKDDKIEVGDEVEWRNIENNGGKGIVLWIADNSVNGRKLCDIMSASGSAGTWYTDEVVKTGRHFDIASILEEMHK